MGVRPLLKPQEPVASGLPPSVKRLNRLSGKRKRQSPSSEENGFIVRLGAYYMDSSVVLQIFLVVFKWWSQFHPFDSFVAEKNYLAIGAIIFAVYYVGTALVFGKTPAGLIVKWTGLSGLIGAGMLVAAMFPKTWDNYKLILNNSPPVTAAVGYMSQNFKEQAMPLVVYFRDENARVIVWSDNRPLMLVLHNNGGRWEFDQHAAAGN